MDSAQLACFLGHTVASLGCGYNLFETLLEDNCWDVLNQPCQHELVVFCQCAHHTPFKFCGKTVECGKLKQEGKALFM